ncbi:putative cyclin-D7-1 [Platanthera guangdongensis]|uniref:Cyclin-D7-1 n=1 Tax=Platanthera guangdongensis TaxID=2320717 RepID=A0ABR2MBE5_9ASPA
MESSCSYLLLLCHEELFTSTTTSSSPKPPSFKLHCSLEEEHSVVKEDSVQENCSHFFQNYLQREQNCTTTNCDKYALLLRSSTCFCKARFRGVQWMLLVILVAGGLRLSLGLKTIFAAVNYFDRFLSLSRPTRQWQTWMAELIAIACLSIASKFEEVCQPTFDEYQMKDLETEKKFDPDTIKEMELLVLKALDWKLYCVTSYSYAELLSGHLSAALMARATDLLIHTLLDTKFIEHNPSVVAVSVLRYAVKEIDPMRLDVSFTFFDPLIPEESKVNFFII